MLSFPTIHLTKTIPSSTSGDGIMTIGEVACFLKVTERTVYRQESAKQIPTFKVDGSWWFSEAGLNKLIEQ
jgi:hypothetical protein